MAVREFFNSMVHTLKMSRKSNKAEFMLYLKLVLLSTAVIGMVGFVIQFVGSLVNLGG